MPNLPVISIIDDDASVRTATESLVRSLGFIALTFPSAEAFLESERLAETDCLITDVQMPGMSGVDLQSRLLDDGVRVPIIFITAFPEDHIRERAQAGGAAAFLTKPFDGQTMIQCIEDALGTPSN
ncbi:Two-component response regulator [Pararobbsia alpina]|uniref:response regulator transcription factor n=1 Tax=Pararobbsia alpina TaxID=621374 RepID=UPI0039A528B8